MQRVDRPTAGCRGVATPVEWRLPAVCAHGAPALRKPKLGAGVAVVVHKGEVFANRHQPVCNGKRMQVNGVLWRLVIEREGCGPGKIWRDADLRQATCKVREIECGEVGGGRFLPAFQVRRVKRIGEEGVLDVRRDEFQMLLLMLEPESDAASNLLFLFPNRIAQERGHRAIDMGPVGQDGVQRGP